MHDRDNENYFHRQILNKSQNVNKNLSADWSKFTREIIKTKVWDLIGPFEITRENKKIKKKTYCEILSRSFL